MAFPAALSLLYTHRFDSAALRRSLLAKATSADASPAWAGADAAPCVPLALGREGQQAAAAEARGLCAHVNDVPDAERELWLGNWLETVALGCSAQQDARAVAAILRRMQTCVG